MEAFELLMLWGDEISLDGGSGVTLDMLPETNLPVPGNPGE
jgi:hypothetical protein